MKTPVTIITGYLGAGKTSLLRRIAKESEMKIAILLNEFGEIAVDSKVIEGKNINMTELLGGCVCCSLSGEFKEAITEIAEKIKPDWIVMETTGVAEPGEVANEVQDGIEGVRLDSIVTIVDSDSLVRFRNLGQTGREQIELADVLILNKIDLVGADDLEKLREAITGLNKRALVLEARHCDIDTRMIFGIGRRKNVSMHKPHEIEFEHFDYATERVLDYGKFTDVLEKLPKTIYRSKGFAKTSGGDYLMNYVAGRYSLEEFQCERTELVFIGKDAAKDERRVLESLEACQLPG